MSRFVPRANLIRHSVDAMERLHAIARGVSPPWRRHDDVQEVMENLNPLGRAALISAIMSVPNAGVYDSYDGMNLGGEGAEPPPLELPLPDKLLVRSTLSEVEDHRTYNFGVTKPLRTVRGNRVRLRVAKAPLSRVGVVETLPSAIAVTAKADTIICIRRNARRGSILALGQGGGYHRKPRRSPTSDIWC